MDLNANPTVLGREVSKKMLEWRTGSPGYWATLLFPLALMLTPSPSTSRVTTAALLIIAINTFVLTYLHYIYEVNLYDTIESMKALYVLLAMMALALCNFNFFGGTIASEYVPFVFLTFTFIFAFRNVIMWYPRSFTFAEGIIVTSAFVYNFYVASQNIPFPPEDFTTLSESQVVVMFVQMGFLGTIILARGLVVLVKQFQWYGLEELYVIWAKIMFAAFAFRLYNDSDDVWFMILWLRNFLIGNPYRRTTLVEWTLLVGVAGVFVTYVNAQATSTSTVHRKAFHILMVLVYIPVVKSDISLLYFCSAGVMFGFLLIETIRALKFEYWDIKFGVTINTVVAHFRDHQDEGKLILTPIYLLAGVSLPIWLTGLYSEKGQVIMTAESIAACLTGVLSIGIGDTFASIGGKLYGRHHFAGSRKTYEGTFCSIVSQLVTVAILYSFRFIPFTFLSCTALCVSVFANAYAESQTDQIDNLVVPLTAYNAFHLVCLFRDFIPFI